MVDDPKITEKDGKKFVTLPNGNQVEVENEVIDNPSWVDVEGAVKIIGVGDRQIRNLAEKNSWDKKYAYINKKPVAYYLKSQLENFQRSRVTEIMSSSEPNITKGEDTPTPEPGTSKGLVSQETLKELDLILKKVEPYVGDFLETYKKNHERIVELEDKKSSAEKTAVLWKTSAIWIAVLAGVAALSWFQLSRINSSLSQNNSSLNTKYESTQNELYETKLNLAEKQHELDLIKSQQPNAVVNSATAGKG